MQFNAILIGFKRPKILYKKVVFDKYKLLDLNLEQVLVATQSQINVSMQ